ncbi:hypothetical protein AFCDBAGC_4280 [Methylobacterium cerastii]|uniref:Uncharacterized protein n=1 Tax=Methylobacterium cerastii TaxID=932741 RepID=A0ABQ4QNU0_9HYPH|nr:hypothetical protein [Methylobacterium cerastii]GJD46399.1 hypothetical protein AFCDBAGC_4280 [Methylobacterium cerastii]
MRAFLSVAFLAIGIAVGGAFPRVSEVVQDALAAAGLTNARATPPTNAAVTKRATVAADDGHGHGEHGHGHADAETRSRTH